MKSYAITFILFGGLTAIYGQPLHTGRVIRSDTRKPVTGAAVFMPDRDSTVFTNALGFFQVKADSGMVIELSATGLVPGHVTVPASPSFTVALEPEELDSTVYVVVEEMATFPGGYPTFYKYVEKNMRIPINILRSNLSGRVFVSFIINADGTIPPDEVKVIQPLHPTVDAEAVRVIRNSPNWNPGRQQGKPVRQRMVLPVSINR
ncbi:MAG: energy transducer TonB [Bacteroidota bacterium]